MARPTPSVSGASAPRKGRSPVAIESPIDPASPRSRRAVLAAALGAGAATVLSAVARPLPAQATDGDTVTVGSIYSATSTTELFNGTNSNAVFQAISATGTALYGVTTSAAAISGNSDSGTGVVGASNSGVGLWGASGSGVGVKANSSSSTGSYGYSGPNSLPAAPANIGVFGAADRDSAAKGVYGKSPVGQGVRGEATTGIGVYGQTAAGGTGVVGFTGSTPPVPPPDTGIYGRSDTGGAGGRGLTGFCATGIGLLGQSDTGEGVVAYCNKTTGNALRVSGKIALSRSGKLTIAAGHSSLTKTGIALTSASFILATLQTNVAGLVIQAVVTNPAGSAFTIYLNKAPSVSVAVAWLAVN
jgi:hypothetical protein